MFIIKLDLFCVLFSIYFVIKGPMAIFNQKKKKIIVEFKI